MTANETTWISIHTERYDLMNYYDIKMNVKFASMLSNRDYKVGYNYVWWLNITNDPRAINDEPCFEFDSETGLTKLQEKFWASEEKIIEEYPLPPIIYGSDNLTETVTYSL